MSGQKKNTTIKKLVPSVEKHLEILLRHKHHYDLFMRSGEIVNFNADIQDELLSVIKLKIPHYDYNRRCDACVCEFLVLTYKQFKDELHPSNGVDRA